MKHRIESPFPPSSRDCVVQVLSIGQWPDFSRYQDLLSLLPSDQQRRVTAYHRDHDRTRSLFGRLLLLSTVYHLYNIPYGACRIAFGMYGKPFLPDLPNFHFSLSHTESRVVFAFAASPLGVDVERLKAYDPRIAARFFTPEENRELARASNPIHRFYQIWTRKEAFIKTTGEGMKRPLSSFDTLRDVRFLTFATEGYLVSLYTKEHLNPPKVQLIYDEDFINKLRTQERSLI